MSLDPEVQALSQSTFFQEIGASRLKLLAFMSDIVVYRSGETLCEQGDTGDTAFFILNGIADIVINTQNGPLVAASLPELSLVGEIAMLCDVPRTAAVVAQTDMRVMIITREAFFNLMNEFPEVSMKVIRLLANRLESTTQDLVKSRSEVASLQEAVASA